MQLWKVDENMRLTGINTQSEKVITCLNWNVAMVGWETQVNTGLLLGDASEHRTTVGRRKWTQDYCWETQVNTGLLLGDASEHRTASGRRKWTQGYCWETQVNTGLLLGDASEHTIPVGESLEKQSAITPRKGREDNIRKHFSEITFRVGRLN
jgi:hypothetical protein